MYIEILILPKLRGEKNQTTCRFKEAKESLDQASKISIFKCIQFKNKNQAPNFLLYILLLHAYHMLDGSISYPLWIKEHFSSCSKLL